MKCTWYADFEGVCTNGECPYRGGTCPTSEYPEVCKYAEYAEKQPEIPQLSVEELAKTLRLCGSASCTGCALSEASDCGNIILSQAADMLEKLAEEIEKERKRRERAMKTPDEIKKAVSLCILCESCTDCPYCESESEAGCMSALNTDALAYIERLEAERSTEVRENEQD